jgi:hypothetical protein
MTIIWVKIEVDVMNYVSLRQMTVESDEMNCETQRFAQQIITISPLLLGIVKIPNSDGHLYRGPAQNLEAGALRPRNEMRTLL